MTPHREDVILHLVTEWLRKADLDLKAAGALLLSGEQLFYPSSFHSQQAAEKYLKAFLTMRQVEFPKTHDIQELLNLAKTVDGKLAESLRPTAFLTPYGVEIRYPAGLPDPTQSEAEQALILAKKVRDAITPFLR